MVETTASFAPPVRLLLGVVAGIVATRGMDVVMARAGLPDERMPQVWGGSSLLFSFRQGVQRTG